VGVTATIGDASRKEVAPYFKDEEKKFGRFHGRPFSVHIAVVSIDRSLNKIIFRTRNNLEEEIEGIPDH
jgi:hypothetical protein